MLVQHLNKRPPRVPLLLTNGKEERGGGGVIYLMSWIYIFLFFALVYFSSDHLLTIS